MSARHVLVGLLSSHLLESAMRRDPFEKSEAYFFELLGVFRLQTFFLEVLVVGGQLYS